MNDLILIEKPTPPKRKNGNIIELWYFKTFDDILRKFKDNNFENIKIGKREDHYGDYDRAYFYYFLKNDKKIKIGFENFSSLAEIVKWKESLEIEELNIDKEYRILDDDVETFFTYGFIPEYLEIIYQNELKDYEEKMELYKKWYSKNVRKILKRKRLLEEEEEKANESLSRIDVKLRSLQKQKQEIVDKLYNIMEELKKVE